MPARSHGHRCCVLTVGLGVLAGLLCGCSGNEAATGKREAEMVSMGAALYEQNCSACHDVNNLQLVKKPPKLIGVFQKPKLPSGAPATDEQVRKTILDGRGIMPPFRQTLDAEQLEDLLKYLHTR